MSEVAQHCLLSHSHRGVFEAAPKPAEAKKVFLLGKNLKLDDQDHLLLEGRHASEPFRQIECRRAEERTTAATQRKVPVAESAVRRSDVRGTADDPTDDGGVGLRLDYVFDDHCVGH